MMFYAHYRIVPTPGTDQQALGQALNKLKLTANRITIDFSSHVIRVREQKVPTFLWRAQVDAQNDRYVFPSPADIQKLLGDSAVVVDREVFTQPDFESES